MISRDLLRAELRQSHHRRTTPAELSPSALFFGPLAFSAFTHAATCTRCGHREISKTLAPPPDRIGLWANPVAVNRGRVVVLEIDCAVVAIVPIAQSMSNLVGTDSYTGRRL